MTRLIVAIAVGIMIAAGGAFAMESLLSSTPGNASTYAYGSR